MNPNWLFLIVSAAVMVGVFGAYYANTYKGMGDDAPQDAQPEPSDQMAETIESLARRSKAFLEQPHTLDIGGVMQLVADMRKALPVVSRGNRP